MNNCYYMVTAVLADQKELWDFYNGEGVTSGAFRPLPAPSDEALVRLFDRRWTRIVMIRSTIDHQLVAAGLVAIFQSLNVTIGHIDYIIVHRNSRRQGLSRMLMHELHHQAIELGVRRFELTSRPKREEARALYESLGYQLIEGSNRHFRWSVDQPVTVTSASPM